MDNQGCLQILKDNVLNERTKHVDFKYQLIMKNAEKGKERLNYLSSRKTISDIMTNALGKTLFSKFRNLIGVCCRTLYTS